MPTLYHGAMIFDGDRLGPGALLVDRGRIAAILPPEARPDATETVVLPGGILAPGFVDLQLNGGGGVMFNDAPSVATLARIAEAHERLGTLMFLPTLITDTSAQTRAAIDAVEGAIAAGISGVAGLHLEGPHLSLARKGAHDPALIRPMEEGDLAMLLDAARRLPRLMVTLAPESVSLAQISALSEAGVIVSLGHTDADFATCKAAVTAGARLATHLFNAMSPLGHREPGLVGTALTTGALDAGLIADGIHVHPAAMAAALAAKAGPGEIFLVTDAMAPAGTGIRRFELNGREILRRDGRLTLADGTLAGADLNFTRAIRVLRDDVGVALDRALAMASRIPARVLGLTDRCGMLEPGRDADFVHLTDDLRLAGVWRKGVPVDSDTNIR
ncbi:N-acetylglucosamine-6-phosphate deacetylase [Defluviimonas sp. WL0024]|uniref:N-acetylglucosamine-6-phosphate deacetylase n=1 Tax=Albidovulum salinarum TaxID=2984153 RepID=A0ABT2WYW4_9RHOB|nr:N-acetylglucosamine-6-phosphate deacetylase [Defluviimonas sp. WL0024]MCU9846858.1 N-acetylglucosamine-6-phosphate deacetylase [Defluviimonas sp. WL0024]